MYPSSVLTSLLPRLARSGCRAFSSFARQPLEKDRVTGILLDAKGKSKLTFKDLSDRLNVNKVWLTAALHGEHPISNELAGRLIKALNITGTSDELQCLTDAVAQFPGIRGAQTNGKDPAVRRMQELIDVYGDSLKALIREEAGDGIMSAIDCTIQFEKVTVKNATGQEEVRIVLKVDGKFLPYKTDHK